MGKLGILFILATAASGFVVTGQGTDPLPEGISEDEISDEHLLFVVFVIIKLGRPGGG